jgi:SAM-dependent methyltransferase
MEPTRSPSRAAADVAGVRAQLWDLLAGFMRTQALAVAARLGVADVVGEEPIDVGEIARRVGGDERSLYRLLRALSSEGVFAEVGPRRFARTPLSDGLRTDEPLTARWIAMSLGSEHYRAWAEAFHSFATGEPGFDHAFGLPYFDFLEQNPEASAVFHRAMGAGTLESAAALTAYEWSAVRQVVDVGGGNGTALAAVLCANPHLSGAVFDLPSALADAPAVLEEAEVADRCELVAGDFFSDPLPSAECYILSSILHDWDDSKAGAILRNCRRSLADGGTLLLVEAVVPSGPEPDFIKLFDLHMLVLLGGKERTEAEWRDLLAEAGFNLTRIAPAGPIHLIQAQPI